MDKQRLQNGIKLLLRHLGFKPFDLLIEIVCLAGSSAVGSIDWKHLQATVARQRNTASG
jgi:hypothetical protein